MLEQHHDTEEDKLEIKKQMAQFIANAVTQVNMTFVTKRYLRNHF